MSNDTGDDRAGFIAYPFGYLFGVVEDTSHGDALASDLERAGFSTETLMRFTGEEGATRIDASGKGHGLFARAVRTLQYSDDSRLHAEIYEREAIAGHEVIGVRAPTTEEKGRARELYAQHGARVVVYYGPTGRTESMAAPE